MWYTIIRMATSCKMKITESIQCPVSILLHLHDTISPARSLSLSLCLSTLFLSISVYLLFYILISLSLSFFLSHIVVYSTLRIELNIKVGKHITRIGIYIYIFLSL